MFVGQNGFDVNATAATPPPHRHGPKSIVTTGATATDNNEHINNGNTSIDTLTSSFALPHPLSPPTLLVRFPCRYAAAFRRAASKASMGGFKRVVMAATYKVSSAQADACCVFVSSNLYIFRVSVGLLFEKKEPFWRTDDIDP